MQSLETDSLRVRGKVKRVRKEVELLGRSFRSPRVFLQGNVKRVYGKLGGGAVPSPSSGEGGKMSRGNWPTEEGPFSDSEPVEPDCWRRKRRREERGRGTGTALRPFAGKTIEKACGTEKPGDEVRCIGEGFVF